MQVAQQSMSAAIRGLLTSQPEVTCKEAMKYVKSHGFRGLKEETFSTTFYSMRSKLRQQAATTAVQTQAEKIVIPPYEEPSRDDLLEAARFLAAFDGDGQAAEAALKRVESLQVPRKPR